MSKVVIAEPYVLGEKPAPLIYQFLDSAGLPIDITGWNVRFSCQERYGAAFTGNGSVYNGANGQASYVWTGAEFPTAGKYRAEFWVGNGTNRYASVDVEFTVSLPVGVPPSI